MNQKLLPFTLPLAMKQNISLGRRNLNPSYERSRRRESKRGFGRLVVGVGKAWIRGERVGRIS